MEEVEGHPPLWVVEVHPPLMVEEVPQVESELVELEVQQGPWEEPLEELQEE